MLKSLQAGRGLAAMAVVAYHLSVYLGDPRFGGDAVFSRFTRYGSLGVDFFFVLSGFIMLHAHVGDIGKPDRWPRYAYRRFARLFPIYWLYTLGFLVLAALTVGQLSPFADELAWWASVVTLVRFSEAAVPLFVAWTLFNELAFYSLFSTLILNRRLGLAVLAIWAGTCAVLFHHQQPLTGTPGDVYSSAYNFNFFLGMGAWWLSRRVIRGWSLLGAGLAVVVGALIGGYSGHEISPLIYALGFALGVAGAARLEAVGSLTMPRALTHLGDASYSLYLLHVPIIAVSLRLLRTLNVEALIGRGPLYLVVLVVTFAGGLTVYRWVERPLIAMLRRLSPFDRPPLTSGQP